MWGFGGRFYWRRRRENNNTKGIVVVFAWMSSQDKHLKNYIHLYSSLGWDSLVCHPQFLNLFFPDKAASLALEILTQLIKELKDRPCPIVFASFSGGPKACMYKLLQVNISTHTIFLLGNCQVNLLALTTRLRDHEWLGVSMAIRVSSVSRFEPKGKDAHLFVFFYKGFHILEHNSFKSGNFHLYVVFLIKACGLLLHSCFTFKKIVMKDDLRLVRDCVSGHIYDSTPVDFTSDLGTRFVLHPTILKVSRPPIIATWIANGISSSLDALFLTKYEVQRADYWQTLYSTVAMGAPYLILCSESDELAPYRIICNFAQRLESLGGDVNLVQWNNSPHVGHYRHHPEEYKAAVTELLTKAASVYSTRLHQQLKSLNSETSADPLQEPSVSSSDHHQTPKRMARDSSQGFNVPVSMEYDQDNERGSVQDEERFILRSKMNVNGVVGEIMLFDFCVPKNVEDWDLRPFGKHSNFNSIKCIRRSKM
ncbi:hypothetical protein OSB04_003038 [Centaurea solstitialis]|uniref:DUF829 domain-containing protein n=1 Tax=Centaurea solstitialis TaxID=347529 RepID=A0AA38UBH2_9ASTR|nr:hypothetical protein OSB04_003038 [Centaurea solstitialis]